MKNNQKMMVNRKSVSSMFVVMHPATIKLNLEKYGLIV